MSDFETWAKDEAEKADFDWWEGMAEGASMEVMYLRALRSGYARGLEDAARACTELSAPIWQDADLLDDGIDYTERDIAEARAGTFDAAAKAIRSLQEGGK